MLRGLYDIIEPLAKIGNTAGPYLGPVIHIMKETVQNALPKMKDPDNAYVIYDGELPSFKTAVVGATDILSTIHPNYLLVAITFLAAFLILYIKMKYPFWNQIPALHVYDWHRRLFYAEKPYIVHVIPKKTKYYEPRLVKTERFQDLEESRKTEMAILLQNHYLPSDRVFCSVKVPDLAAQCANATVSMWNRIEEDIVSLNDLQTDRQTDRQIIVQTKRGEVEGFITSRRIRIAITLGELEDRYIVQEPANYIDYLCFHRTLAFPLNIRKLFHTHEYNERQMFPERNITVFKKEVELCEAIVPLVEYETLSFYLRHKIEHVGLPVNFQMVRIQKENLSNLHDWMERVASLKENAGFRISVTAEISDLIHLLQTNQMFAYVLRGPDLEIKTKLDAVYAIYFFRNGHMKYEDLEGGDTLHAIAAFCNTNDFELYFGGFVWAVRLARKDFSGMETKMIMVDDLGHLRGIVKRWQQTHEVVLRTRCAYYFCNYILPRSPYLAGTVNVLL